MADSNTLRPRGGELGKSQIAWLRKNIPSFDLSWTAVKAADDNVTKQNAKVLGK